MPTPPLLADAAARRGIDVARVLARRDAHLAERGKRCPSCETVKPVSEWGRDAAQPDGLATRCRACRRAPCLR